MKNKAKKYLRIVLFLAGMLLISFLWIWWDAVPSDAIDYGYLGTISKVENRFAVHPFLALLRSDGFALNFLLTFLFLVMLLAAALLPVRLYRRFSTTVYTAKIEKKTVCDEICLWLLSIPLTVLTISSFFNNIAFAILPYLLACGYLYLRCDLITRDEGLYGQRRTLLFSCTMGLTGCAAVILLLQVVLNAIGIVYRARTVVILYLLLVLFSYGVLVIMGQMVFSKLHKAAPSRRQTGRLGINLLLAGVLVLLIFFFTSVTIFGTDLAGDILVVREDGQAYIMVSFSPWFRDSWEEKYQHICTFFMRPNP